MARLRPINNMHPKTAVPAYACGHVAVSRQDNNRCISTVFLCYEVWRGFSLLVDIDPRGTAGSAGNGLHDGTRHGGSPFWLGNNNASGARASGRIYGRTPTDRVVAQQIRRASSSTCSSRGKSTLSTSDAISSQRAATSIACSVARLEITRPIARLRHIPTAIPRPMTCGRLRWLRDDRRYPVSYAASPAIQRTTNGTAIAPATLARVPTR